MFSIFNKRESSLSSSKELRAVQMHVYTKASGPIGRMVGRDLKIRVDGFQFMIADSVGPTGDKTKRLTKVVVDADSLTPVADVDDRKFERLLLTLQEAEKVARRAKTAVLESMQYPTITYTVDSEDSSSVSGRLDFHGEERPVRCSKVLDGPELVVTCPVDFTQHGATPYRHMLGLFSVASTVEVVTRVPTSLLL